MPRTYTKEVLSILDEMDDTKEARYTFSAANVVTDFKNQFHDYI